MRASRLISLLVFLGAFLLFQVQPLLSRSILPWFGGTPAVWTTCMLFFQCGLLAGYAYAYLLTRHLTPRWQAIVHLLLLCAAAATLPVIPSEALKPAGNEEPIRRILAILAATVGLPYLALSATNPLLQAWVYRNGRESPFHLYALSNLGSFAALLTYPFAVEPFLPLRGQAWAWSALFGIFALGCAWAAATSGKHARVENVERPGAAEPRSGDRARWLLQSATGAILLLSITNYVCLEVAAVPLLWIVPLMLYLLSFVLAFDRDRWYSRRTWLLVLFGSALALALAEALPSTALPPIALAWFAVLFSACMICHGELARSRPHPQFLTGFYLTAAAGGALGGIFVGVVAPRIFDAYLELPLGLLLVLVIASLSMRRHAENDRALRVSTLFVALTVIAALTIPMVVENRVRRGAIATARGFFGSVRVTEDSPADPAERKRSMMNGRVLHGLQYVDPGRRSRPTSYYGPESGAGLLLSSVPGGPRRIGVLGLGTGTMAAYGRSGDTIRFYEINPDVVTLARRYFTFLAESRATIEITLGDGRTVLEREPDQHFDALLLDVYSGGSIPVHLFTVDAFRTYLRHLAPAGVIALHVTNENVDLAPLAFALARHFGLSAGLVSADGDAAGGTLPSSWVLMSRDRRFLSSPAIRQALSRPPSRRIRPWTDARNSLLDVLIW